MKEFDLQRLIRPNVLAMQAYRSARDDFEGGQFHFLDANENPFPNGHNRYPDPHSLGLREALARHWQLQPEQVFCGHGSDEAIDLLMRAFARPGQDAVAQITPSYGMYRVSAELNDLRVIDLPLDASFDLDPGKTISQLEEEQPRLLFLCSPNNPTGNLLQRERVAQVIQQFNGLVVIDEAYADFCTEASWLAHLSRYPNLVVLQTFSKARGRAALRVGMAYASPEIIAVLEKIKPPYNLSAHSQAEAMAALKDEALPLQCQTIIAERERVASALASLGSVTKVYPSQANFLLITLPQASVCYQFLLKRGLVVRNRSSMIADSLRITIGQPAENTALLQAMQEWNEKTEKS